MDFIGTKIDGKPVFPAPVAELRRKAWDRIKEGGTFKSSLTVPREKRSKNQLGAQWGLAIATAVLAFEDLGWDTSILLNTPKPTGIAIDSKQLCNYLYNVCPTFNQAGKHITLSDMDTKEAAKFFEDTRNFMASQWNIVIPEPDPNWKERSNDG